MSRWFGTATGKTNEQVWYEGQAEQHRLDAEKAEERKRSYEPSSSSGASDAAAAALAMLLLLGFFWLAKQIIKGLIALLRHMHNSMRERYGDQAIRYEFLGVLALLVVVVWTFVILLAISAINH